MVIRTLVLRPLRYRPWRFLVTVVGVAAGVAAVVATVAASRAAVRAFTEGVEEVAGAVRVEVSRPDGVPSSVFARLRPLAADAEISPVVEEVALLVELGDGVRVLGVDFLTDGLARPVTASPEVRDGLMTALTERAVVISDELARSLGRGSGDMLTLSARARPQQVRVSGVFVTDGLAAVWDRVVLMDVALAMELFGRDDRVDRLELVPRPGVTTDELRQSLVRLLPEGYEVAAPSARRQRAEQMVASLRFNLTSLSAISMIVGAVLVATTLATSVVQRRYTIALLRSLGASRAQIATAVLVEASVIGLSGGILGTAAGIVGARAALESVRYSVAALLRGGLASDIAAEPWVLGLGLGLAVVVSAVAAILPLHEALQTPPLQGLVDTVTRRLDRRRSAAAVVAVLTLAAMAAWLVRLPAWQGLPVAALVACLAVLAALLVCSAPLLDLLSRVAARWFGGVIGPVVRLAVAAVAAGRRRAAWAAGAVAVAVALAVAIVVMVTSFRGTVERWTEEGMRADVWVRPLALERGVPTGELDPSFVGLAESLFGAQAVDPFYSVDVTFRDRPVTLGAAAFDVVSQFGSVYFPGRDSREVFRQAFAGDGAVVNEPFANRFGVKEGDQITLELPNEALTVPVVGVFSDYSRSHGLVVVDRSLFLPHFPNRGPLDVAVFLPPEADATAARERLLEAARGRFLIEAFSNRELKREVLEAFDRTFAITAALAVVAAAVAVTAVMTVLLTLVGERRRELATIRAVGGSRPQLAALVVVEAALLGIAASGLGVVGGLIVGTILVEVVNLQSFGWTLGLVIPWRDLAVLVAWIAAACALAGLAPAAAAHRLEPAAVLREER